MQANFNRSSVAGRALQLIYQGIRRRPVIAERLELPDWRVKKDLYYHVKIGRLICENNLFSLTPLGEEFLRKKI